MEDRIYPNKTMEYLSPIILDCEPEFVQDILEIPKLRYGIHDTLFDGLGAIPYSIYIQYRKMRNSYLFDIKLNRLLNHRRCIYHYNPTPDPMSDIGMMVVEIPEAFKYAYEQFIQGKYSKMYTPRQIDDFFMGEQNIKDVLLKKDKARMQFVSRLNKDFMINMSLERFYPDEYEYPLLLKEEVFNVDNEKSMYLSEELITKLMNRDGLQKFKNGNKRLIPKEGS